MIGFVSALLAACSVALPDQRNTALPTPIPLMESPVSPPAKPEQPVSAATPPGTIVLDAATITVPTTPTPVGVSTSSEAGTGNPAVAAAREMLAKQLQIAPSAIQVILVEEVQWPDGCLGVRTPGMFCIQIVIPGYRVVLAVDGQRYTYHTDLEGRQVVRADPRP